MYMKESLNPSIQLYSPKAIALGAFLGSPIGGGALLSVNFRRIGNSAAANLSLLGGFVFTTAQIGLAMFSHNALFRSSSLTAVMAGGVYGLAKAIQGNIYDRHIQEGGA